MMALSKELQLGKAAEHIVCADLILQGYSAFLADQGLPYDVVVDHNHSLVRVQVRSTQTCRDYGKSHDIYRFGLRSGNQTWRRLDSRNVDYFAFVALDKRLVAYLHIDEVTTDIGLIMIGIEMKSRAMEYHGRTYPNGTIRTPYGRFIEDYGVLKL